MLNRPTLIAAIQMSSTPNRDDNLRQAEALLTKAAQAGAKLAVFPENFTLFSPNRETTLKNAQDLKGQTVQTLCQWARHHKITLVAGSIAFKIPSDKNRVTNTSLVISPQGRILARYDKIHLFDAKVGDGETYRESRSVRPGKRPVVVKTPVGTLGLSICYDLRFPELYRALVKSGAEILVVPSAFTRPTGRAHWEILLRARAIENQCYVIAPAQTGTHFSGRETHGNTLIIDPWGEIIARQAIEPGVVLATLDPKRLKEVREKMLSRPLIGFTPTKD